MGSKILYMLPALVLAFLALVLALVGLSRDPEPVTVTATETTGQADQEEAAPSYEYWVLRQPMNAGEALSEESLAVVTSPNQISDALSAEEDVFGRELRRYARPGELLSSHHLESGGSLPANLPEGQRAIAIGVDDVVGAGGLLQPGDRVDVVTAFRRSDKDAPVALVMLRDVPVLAVYGSLSAGADDAARGIGDQARGAGARSDLDLGVGRPEARHDVQRVRRQALVDRDRQIAGTGWEQRQFDVRRHPCPDGSAVVELRPAEFRRVARGGDGRSTALRLPDDNPLVGQRIIDGA